MKTILFYGLLLLTTSVFVSAQVPEQKAVSQKPTAPVAETEKEKKLPESTDDQTAKKSDNVDDITKPAPQGYVRPDAKKRFNRYTKSMFGPTALGKTVFGAGYNTWQNSPEEWGGQWEGFGRRVASGLGKSVIKNTTQYALDEAFELDSAFYRSQKRDFGSRLKNALISPVTARNKEGKRVFGFPRVVGTYTASIVAAETWYPDRYNYKNGLRSGTISLGTSALFNVVKEFFLK